MRLLEGTWGQGNWDHFAFPHGLELGIAQPKGCASR